MAMSARYRHGTQMRVKLTQVRNTDQEVGEYEAAGAIEPICAFFGIHCPILQEGRHICHGHKGHERGTKEDGVDLHKAPLLIAFITGQTPTLTLGWMLD
jgi:hypothetical protein